MDYFEVLGKMMVILFAMAAGYLAHHLGYLGGEVDEKLCKLLLNITMPAMIIATVTTGDSMAGMSEILSLLKVGFLLYGTAFLFALTIPRFMHGTPAQTGAWRYALAFSNVGFIGFPVAVALYGPDSLFYASILVLPCNLLSYTLGPMMLAGVGRFRWQQLVSPCVVAAVAALTCALTGFRPPAMVGNVVKFLGDVTVPLSLLVIGSLLAGLPVRQVFASPKVWLLSVLRLLIMPAALYYILLPLHLEPMILGIAVTQIGMPVAVNGTMLSMEYGGDTESLAQVTFLTTLAATVTIPLLATLFL